MSKIQSNPKHSLLGTQGARISISAIERLLSHAVASANSKGIAKTSDCLPQPFASGETMTSGGHTPLSEWIMAIDSTALDGPSLADLKFCQGHTELIAKIWIGERVFINQESISEHEVSQLERLAVKIAYLDTGLQSFKAA